MDRYGHIKLKNKLHEISFTVIVHNITELESVKHLKQKLHKKLVTISYRIHSPTEYNFKGLGLSSLN